MILDTFCGNFKPRRGGAVTPHPRPRERLTPAVQSRPAAGHRPSHPAADRGRGQGEAGAEVFCNEAPPPRKQTPCSPAYELSIPLPTVYIEHTGLHAHSCMPARTFTNRQTRMRALACTRVTQGRPHGI